MKAETRVRKFRLHRGRAHKPKPPPDPPYPLADHEFRLLVRYNDEKARGLVHTGRWDDDMARLQRRHDKWEAECADRYNAWAESAVRAQLKEN